MRSIYALVLIFSLVSIETFAQSDCQVLLHELKGSYDGACKRGLAHGEGKAIGIDQYTGEFRKGLPDGKGIYIWKNGTLYDGEFSKGEKYGEGKMIFKMINQEDSLVVGFWKEDKYIGKYKNPYTLHYKSPNVTRVKVTSGEDDENVIFITIGAKGKTESNPEIQLSEKAGSYSSIQSFGRVTKVFIVRYPFRFNLNYLGESVDLEILTAGSWNVNIDINK